MDSNRPSKLDSACKMSNEVYMESQRLSKLATAFEESLRVSRDSSENNGEKSNTSSADSKRPIVACDAAEKSVDASIMERCLAAMTHPSSRASGDHEEPKGNTTHEDDEDCSSLLASLSDLQTQLQQEIRHTQERFHDRHHTTKRGVEDDSLNNRTSFEQGTDSVRSRLEDTVTELSATVNHTSTTTTTSATATTTRAETTTTPATMTSSAATVTTLAVDTTRPATTTIVSTTVSATTTPATTATTKTTTTTTGNCMC